MQTATTKAPSWRELCDLQPELSNEIQAIRDDGEHFCANYVWRQTPVAAGSARPARQGHKLNGENDGQRDQFSDLARQRYLS